ncbi:MAG: hypothetical protein ABMB14_25735 [Myxococcota bacterium]
MYGLVLMAHSLLRWLVLVAMTALGVRGVIGWQSAAPHTALDRRLALVTLIVLDLQLTLGLALLAVSPTVHGAFADMGAAMGDAAIRLRVVEHPFTMVLGVALFHVGYALTKRRTDDVSRHRTSVMFTCAALALVLSRIPW